MDGMSNTKFYKNLPVLNFMKVHPDVLELSHANRLTKKFCALQRDVNMVKMTAT
jgi:hypothetical protein